MRATVALVARELLGVDYVGLSEMTPMERDLIGGSPRDCGAAMAA